MFDIVAKSRTKQETETLMELRKMFSADPQYSQVALPSEDQTTQRLRDQLGDKLFTISTPRWLPILITCSSVGATVLECHDQGFHVKDVGHVKRFDKFIKKNVDHLMHSIGTTIDGMNLDTMRRLTDIALMYNADQEEPALAVIEQSHALLTRHFLRHQATTAPMVVNGGSLAITDPETKIDVPKLTVDELQQTLVRFNQWLNYLEGKQLMKYGVEVW